MKLNARALSLSAALVAAISWVLCSLLIALAPAAAARLDAAMFHLVDTPTAPLSITLPVFIVGLVAWTLIAAAFAGFGAALYNGFVSPAAASRREPAVAK